MRRISAERGVALERFRIGSKRNSINPETGVPEFFDSLFPKGAYDPCNLGAEYESCKGWDRDYLRNSKPMHKPTPEELARLPDAQKEEYAKFHEGAGDYTSAVGLLGVPGRLYQGARNILLRGLGKVSDEESASHEEIARAYRSGITNPKSGR